MRKLAVCLLFISFFLVSCGNGSDKKGANNEQNAKVVDEGPSAKNITSPPEVYIEGAGARAAELIKYDWNIKDSNGNVNKKEKKELKSEKDAYFEYNPIVCQSSTEFKINFSIKPIKYTVMMMAPYEKNLSVKGDIIRIPQVKGLSNVKIEAEFEDGVATYIATFDVDKST